MGAECSIEEREFRYDAFHQSIYSIEKDIKNELNSLDISKKKYSPFGLINQGICKKYRFLLKQNLDKNEARKKVFDYNDLKKDNIDKDFSYINPDFTFNFPSNFIFVNKEFLEVIHDNVTSQYQKYLTTVFNTIIGGDCLIMKDRKDKNDNNPFRYIILYYEIKENKGNEIDFFLYFKDKNDRKSADNYILTKNLWNYFNKINYDYRNEFMKIKNEKNKEIGYIVRCASIERVDIYKKLMESKRPQIPQNNFSNLNNLNSNNFGNNNNNLNLNNFNNNKNNSNNPNINNFNNSNNQNNNIFNNSNNSNNFNNFNKPNNINNYNKQNMALNPMTLADKTKYTNISPDLLLEPVILFLYQFENLKILLTKNKNVDLPSFKNIILGKLGANIKNMKSYGYIFEAILTKLDPNIQSNRDYYNQSAQYDEQKGLSKFMENHNNGNVLQKEFLIPREDSIYCKKCLMNIYNFEYSKFIYLKNLNTDNITKKLFDSEKENKKGKFCNFCGGNITEVIIEKKFLDYPKNLIVIIEPSQVNFFKLGANYCITNKINMKYFLYEFIEVNTNSLYELKYQNDNITCNKIEKNKISNSEKIDNKRAIVLFYKLIKKDVNNNIPNNMKNISNQNNFQNMNLFNNQQQFGQNLNPLNINPQNNFQNINQQNANQFNANMQNMNQPMNNQPNQNQQYKNQQNGTSQNVSHTNIAKPAINQGMMQQPTVNQQITNIDKNKKINPQQNIQNSQINFNNQNIAMNMNLQNNMDNNFQNNMNQNMNFNNNMNNNQNLYDRINYLTNEIFTLKNTIQLKDNEIKELKLRINNLVNNTTQLVDFNKIKVVQFISMDHTIICGIKCLLTDTFAEVEEKLYKIYPEYRETNNVFQVDGRNILRFKTIAENNIQEGHGVQIIRIE